MTAERHGRDAAGARYLKPGFAWSPEQDLAWALGWPYVIRLSDEVVDPVAGAFSYLDHPVETEWHRRGVFPREVAYRLLRVIATKSPGPETNPKGGGWLYTPTSANRAAAKKSGEPSDAELKEIVASLFDRAQYWGSTVLRDWPLLLEAVTGPDRALELIVGDLERRTIEHFETTRCDGYLARPAFLLGFLLLRVHRDAEAGFRTRIDALHSKLAKRWSGDDAFDGRRVLDPLDLVLHGAAAVRRSAHRDDHRRLSETDVLFCYDDPALVDEAACAVYGPREWAPVPNVRACFVGTDKALAAFAKRWPRIKYASELIELLDQVGEIRSPVAVQILRDAATKSKAKTHAKTWFTAHPDRGELPKAPKKKR